MRLLLMRRLSSLGPFIDGTIVDVEREGRPTQRRVQRYRDRKMHAVHVPRDLEGTVGEWSQEYQHALDLLRAMSEINEQVIRNYVSDKRASGKAAKECAQLRLLDDE